LAARNERVANLLDRAVADVDRHDTVAGQAVQLAVRSAIVNGLNDDAVGDVDIVRLGGVLDVKGGDGLAAVGQGEAGEAVEVGGDGRDEGEESQAVEHVSSCTNGIVHTLRLGGKGNSTEGKKKKKKKIASSRTNQNREKRDRVARQKQRDEQKK
jgi:hypothetical protein